MKMIYVLIGLVAVAGVITFAASCTNKKSSPAEPGTKTTADTGTVKETKVQENRYPEMRGLSLSVTAEQLELALDSNTTTVYGVVMDWDIGEAIATVIAFKTGDASLYTSAGQIYIGGYAHENINRAGRAFVEEAQAYVAKAKPAANTELPDKGCVKFYLLTNKGKYVFQETVANITNKNSAWTKLFNHGNNVITEYRKTTDKGN